MLDTLNSFIKVQPFYTLEFLTNYTYGLIRQLFACLFERL